MIKEKDRNPGLAGLIWTMSQEPTLDPLKMLEIPCIAPPSGYSQKRVANPLAPTDLV